MPRQKDERPAIAPTINGPSKIVRFGRLHDFLIFLSQAFVKREQHSQSSTLEAADHGSAVDALPSPALPLSELRDLSVAEFLAIMRPSARNERRFSILDSEDLANLAQLVRSILYVIEKEIDRRRRTAQKAHLSKTARPGGSNAKRSAE